MDSGINRRDFLRSAGMMAGGLPILTAKPKGVELAIATITCDGFGDEDFQYAFEILPRLPFRNVEFNCWYARNLTPEGIRSIRERCRRHGLTPVCVQGTSFGAGGNIVKDVTHKLWNMEAARRLGCRRVKFTGAGRGSEGGLDAVINVVKELVPAAEEMDMLVLLENHANNNLENLDDYDRVFSAVPSPRVGMCMDNAHFNGAGVDLFQVIDRFHSRILHIDLKDTERMGVHKVVRFGQGVTDNAGVVERMLQHGYTGYLVVEMAPPLDRTTLESDLRRAYDLFKKYER
ncbi:sugar phosphate isomerase/epimerase family protein [Larkinella soli]|uniref:sugar phosphate isomerase/epimerase family protein n=1 Tax=Larkinella soli TaxID=1770527 RepID=UPI001E2A49AE|nr:sugar phosphate isomerase/epimerase family protein [Larkinella soli]